MSKLVKLFRHPLRFWRGVLARHKDSSISLDRPDSDPKLLEAQKLFRQGKVGSAHKILEQIQSPNAETHLLWAQMALAAGCYSDAENHAFQCMMKSAVESAPFKESFYVRLESLRFMRQHPLTLDALSNMPFRESNNRYFRALRLAITSVSEIQAYKTRLCAFNKNKKANDRGLYHYSILLRDFEFYDQAIEVAKERFVNTISNQKFGSRQKKINKNWTNDAKVALADLKADLEMHGIEFFLISGTLLGCIREGGIIGHDKDIDVGFDEKYSKDEIKEAIRLSPRFHFLEISFDDNVYIQHVNGVSIDIFRHYVQDGLYVHEGIKAKWWNTPFELKQVKFLDGEYFVPADTDVYLTENYGNWRVSDPDFETFVDTPNMQVTVKGQMLWYYMTKLSDYYLYGKKPQLERVWQAYSKIQPETCFAEKFIIPLLSRV